MRDVLNAGALSLFVGVFAATFAYYVVGTVYSPTTMRTRNPMAVHLENLQKIGIIALPQRIPGASLGVVPPDDVPLHTTPPPKTFKSWVRDRPIVLKIQGKMMIIESQESFSQFWEDKLSAERKRVHRDKHAFREDAWRLRWAAYPTQGWPTLSTTGHATDVIANIVPQSYFDISSYQVSPVR